MSNNDLYCPKCRGQHHPAECAKDGRAEIEKIIDSVSYNVHCNDKQAISKAIEQYIEDNTFATVEQIEQHIIKETDNRMKSMNDDMEAMSEAHKYAVIKARIKDREATKALMDYTGDTDLWYEDNEEKLAQLRKD